MPPVVFESARNVGIIEVSIYYQNFHCHCLRKFDETAWTRTNTRLAADSGRLHPAASDLPSPKSHPVDTPPTGIAVRWNVAAGNTAGVPRVVESLSLPSVSEAFLALARRMAFALVSVSLRWFGSARPA